TGSATATASPSAVPASASRLIIFVIVSSIVIRLLAFHCRLRTGGERRRDAEPLRHLCEGPARRRIERHARGRAPVRLRPFPVARREHRAAGASRGGAELRQVPPHTLLEHLSIAEGLRPDRHDEGAE